MRYWSLLFVFALVVCSVVSAYAPFDPTWWLPSYRETNASELHVLERIARELPAEFSGEDASLLASPDWLAERKAWVEHAQKDLRQLVHRDFLTTRIRLVQDRANGLSEAISEASRAATSDVESKKVAFQLLVERANAMAESAEAAMASISEPGTSLSSPSSTAAIEIDHLFAVVLGITAITFIGTMVAYVWFLWRYAHRPGRQALYSHGSIRVELVWTLIPATILIFLAFYQYGAWADIKFRTRRPDIAPTVEVTGRQFMWRVRYPGLDGVLNSADDLITFNDLHLVRGETNLIHLKSEDVIHSFFLPQLRIKQDAMPGWTVPVWFDVNKAGRYELLCAELCGWGHYKMRADLVVHETQADFNQWLEDALRQQNQSQVSVAEAGGEE